jgi:DNA-directed RNA polymerase specialized sigma54-like protein
LKLNQKSINLELNNDKIETVAIKNNYDSKKINAKLKTDSKPYMFNKLPGAPWVAKKIPSKTKTIKTKIITNNFFILILKEFQLKI